MKVLSLFDGMSCGQIALDQLGIPVDTYYASEIDKYAIQVTQANYPKTIQVGDVTKLDPNDFTDVDLIMAGSPCQGFSFAGKQLAFDDPRSALFFEFIKLLKAIKPKYFLLENVRMKKEFLNIISQEVSKCYPEIAFGIDPIFINSDLVSAQSRQRYYWTNIPNIQQPEDRDIKLKDIILEDGEEPLLSNIYGGFKEKKPRVHFKKSVTIRTASGGGHIPSLIHSEKALAYMNRKTKDGRTHWDFKHHSDTANDKSSCITANLYKGVPYNVLVDNGCIRKLHPIECERLQTVPDNYTEGVSNTRRYHMLGNGWTVEVIKHILQNMET
jgi:DNA-cytosine methyltransferase